MLDSEPDAQFFRTQKRVPVRRGPITRKAANRLKQVGLVAAALVLVMLVGAWLYRYAEEAPRFRVESSDQIVVEGAQNITRSQVLEVFGSDIGRNVFFVPIGDRKRQLERIPWVQSAAVMRLLPNQIHVAIEERTPVAFAQVGPRIALIDSNGVLLDANKARKTYSFPVIAGMNEAEPLSTRAARMRIFSRLVRELDAGNARYSEDLSEVDLRDPEDVRITVSDDDGPVLIHLGDSNFLDRYKTYISHLQVWRQQYHKIESVDLRFDRQVIVHPDPAIPAAAPAARSAYAPPAQVAHRSSKTPSNPVHKPGKTAFGRHGQSTAQPTDGH